MLQERQVVAAISKFNQRSERQEDVQRLIGTYVDVGVLPQLANTNHQVFYGRRGTGKTHVMRVLAAELREDQTNTAVYIDCRTLGSTEQFSDDTLPVSKRCLALFRDVLLEIYHSLIEHIVEQPSDRAEEALKEADQLVKLITEPIQRLTPEKVQDGSTSSENSEVGVELEGAATDFRLAVSAKAATEKSKTRQTDFAVESADKVIFPELQRSLKKTLLLAKTHIYILIDEWSSIPSLVQPYLAEFLKRSVLPIPSATVKISALEYRCHFALRKNDDLIGFELGADIAAAQDLDDYFVYDRNPNKITDVYADVLYRHLANELPVDFLSQQYGVSSGKELASRLFTGNAALTELARAAEGVMRDLINIFTKAAFNARNQGRDKIDKKAVIDAARAWFEQDKSQQLDNQLQEILRRIVTDVIGRRRARSFLLPRHLERNAVIQRLFDARVLHHMQRGYADKDNPGVRYNIYAIDYGAYVDLIGTSKEPETDLVEHEDSAEFVVPFDDKRSIRRIVLEENILSIEQP